MASSRGPRWSRRKRRPTSGRRGAITEAGVVTSSMMRAALFRRNGGPEVMEVGEVPTPTPGPGEVQIGVTAAALDQSILWLRQGLPALPVPLPHVSGGDVCGVVAELGAGVAARPGCSVGDRVLVNPGHSCGRCVACVCGRDNLCRWYRLMGEDLGRLRRAPRRAGAERRRRRRRVRSTTRGRAADHVLTAWQMLTARAGQARRRRAGHGRRLRRGVGGDADRQAPRRARHRDRVDRRQAGRGARARRRRDDQPRDRGSRRRGQAADRQARGRHRLRARRRRGVAEIGGRLRQGGRIVTCGATAGYERAPTCVTSSSASSRSSARPWVPRAICSTSSTWWRQVASARRRPDHAPGRGPAAHRLLESRETFGKLVLVSRAVSYITRT